MFLLSLLSTFAIWTTTVQSLECELHDRVYGKTCTFYGVNTTENLTLNLTSTANNTIVEIVQFRNSILEVLTNELCETFPNLQRLRVVNNSLNSINSGALYNCKNLTVANFTGNNLVELDHDVFEQNIHLIAVNLGDNRLKAIDGTIFSHLNQLSMLNLAKNALTNFSVDQFQTLENLTELYLQSNNLSHLDEQTILQKFPNLKKIQLNNNLFECSHLRTITDNLRGWNITIVEYEDVKCDKFEPKTTSATSESSNYETEQIRIKTLEEEVKSLQESFLVAKHSVEIINGTNRLSSIITKSFLERNIGYVVIGLSSFTILIVVLLIIGFVMICQNRRKISKFMKDVNDDIPSFTFVSVNEDEEDEPHPDESEVKRESRRSF